MSRLVIKVKGFDKNQGQGLVAKSKVTEKNFELVKENIPKLNHDGEVLVEPLWITVDPYLRSRLATWNDKPVISGQVVKIIDSKNKDYPIGSMLLSYLGWSTHNIISAEELKQCARITQDYIPKNNNNDDEEKKNIPDVSKIPLSYYLGAFGMPGRTAYYGLIDLGGLKKDEKKQILISGAAGAVGSLVGQIAKLYSPNCRVVGTAGSKDKLEWLKKIGFDEVINYKDYKDVNTCQDALKKALPNGIDIYFDNTGGLITDSIWDLTNNFARVLVCGQIAYYDTEHIPKIEPFLHKLIYKQVTIQGFVSGNFKDYDRFNREMGSWIVDDKIKAEETIYEGFEQLPQAFLGLFTGQNTGKMLVKCTK